MKELDIKGRCSGYGWDAIGEKNETRAFNTPNDIASSVNNSVTKPPTYNANGQLTADGITYTYEWDGWGRMTKITLTSGASV